MCESLADGLSALAGWTLVVLVIALVLLLWPLLRD